VTTEATPVLGVSAPRRIVAGLDDDGRSVVAIDEPVDPVDYAVAYPGTRGPGETPVTEIHRVWAWDGEIELPLSGHAVQLGDELVDEDVRTALARSSAIPSGGGVRVTFVKFLPDRGEADRPPMTFRWHDSLTVLIPVAGRLGVDLDDGTTVDLGVGDVLVLPGVNHRWRPSAEGALVAYVVIGARRTGLTPPSDNHGAPGR
jgi:hypothetical protein